MNQFKSILLGSVLRIRSLAPTRPSKITSMSHVATGGMKVWLGEDKARDRYEKMTVKQLRTRMTVRRIKGRSKITRKADIIAALLK